MFVDGSQEKGEYQIISPSIIKNWNIGIVLKHITSYLITPILYMSKYVIYKITVYL